MFLNRQERMRSSSQAGKLASDRRTAVHSQKLGGERGNIWAQFHVIKTHGRSLLIAFIFPVKQEARNQLQAKTWKLFKVRETEGMKY